MRSFLFLLFLLILVSFPVLVLPRIILVKKITCINQFGPCSDYLAQEIQGQKDQNLFATKKNLSQILESQIQVSGFSFKFTLPDRLEVFVIERKPVLALNISGSIYLVDSENYVVAQVEESNLPTVFFSPRNYQINIGARVPDELLFVSELAQKLFAAYAVKSFFLTDASLKIDLNGMSVIFPTTGDANVLVGSLRFVLSQLNSRQGDFKIGKASVIDLRFENPVVK